MQKKKEVERPWYPLCAASCLVYFLESNNPHKPLTSIKREKRKKKTITAALTPSKMTMTNHFRVQNIYRVSCWHYVRSTPAINHLAIPTDSSSNMYGPGPEWQLSSRLRRAADVKSLLASKLCRILSIDCLALS